MYLGLLLIWATMRGLLLTNLAGAAWVDDEDFERLALWRWSLNGRGYAQASGGKFLHRVVMEATAGQYVDHINGDKLDCRKCNLRLCDCSQNRANSVKTQLVTSSQFKGVCRVGERWRAHIGVYGRSITIGVYDDEIAAALAYDEHARVQFGEFARLNFPVEVG